MWCRKLFVVSVLAGVPVFAGAQVSNLDAVKGQSGELKTVRPAGANLCAADYPSIQAALDALPPTGGRVFVPAGTYVLTGSLKPRDNVTIAGAGPATVLKACDFVVAKTTTPINAGDTQVAVDNTAGFQVRMEVFAHKNIEWAPGVEKAFSYTITAIDGKTLKFDKPAAFAQPIGATVCTGVPVILVFRKRNVVIEQLTIDGNRKPDWVYVNLKMGGMYLWGTSDCTVQNCHVINTSGDGISAQFPPTGYSGSVAEGPMGWATADKHEGNGTLILNNRVRGASGFGIHLGGGQTKTIVKGNIVDASGWDGFYWCWDNSFTIVSDNIFTRNGWNGIGGYGDGSAVVSDTQNINSNNICAYNAYSGIAVTGGSGNILSGNVCFANSRAARGVHPGIKISIPQSDPKRADQPFTINAVVTGNSCNDVGEKATQKCGIEVAKNVQGVVVRDNISTGNLGADALPDVRTQGK